MLTFRHRECSDARSPAIDLRLVTHTPVERGLKESDNMNSFMSRALSHPRPSDNDQAVRKRAGPGSGEGALPSDSVDARSSDDADAHRLNPLHQFSAMPPPSLREAQSCFESAVGLSIKVTQGRQAYDRACSEYEQLRT